MKRAYFVSDTLTELESVEEELEKQGINERHMHVLTADEAGVQERRLNPVASLLRLDVIHQGVRGAIFGTLIAGGLVSMSYLMGGFDYAGAVPFIFLGLFVVGFSIWEFGLIGIQQMNYKFKDFKNLLARGKHIFFVDYDEKQYATINSVVHRHRDLRAAGTGSTLVNPFQDIESHRVM